MKPDYSKAENCFWNAWKPTPHKPYPATTHAGPAGAPFQQTEPEQLREHATEEREDAVDDWQREDERQRWRTTQDVNDDA